MYQDIVGHVSAIVKETFLKGPHTTFINLMISFINTGCASFVNSENLRFE